MAIQNEKLTIGRSSRFVPIFSSVNFEIKIKISGRINRVRNIFNFQLAEIYQQGCRKSPKHDLFRERAEAEIKGMD